MKKRNLICCLVVVLLTVLSVPVLAGSGVNPYEKTWYDNDTFENETTQYKAAVKKPDYKYLYQEFLKKGKFSTKSGTRTYSVKITSFYVLDIDKNKIPELIIKESSPSTADAMGTHYVFTIKNDKVVLAGEFGIRGQSNIYYSSKYHALYNSGWTNFVGGSWQYLRKMSGSVLKEYKYSWEGSASMGSSTQVYYKGTSSLKQSKVSKKTYLSFCNKYFNAKDLKTYKFVSNTKTNRDKLL